MPYKDLNKRKEYASNYRKTHRNEATFYAKKYREKNKKKLQKKVQIKHQKTPWKRIHSRIKQRCSNQKHKDYKWYGKKGIKCLITKEEIKEIWFRDKAFEMERPSIDRINNDGDYCIENCRLIELSENVSRAFRKSVLQFNLQGNFIKEWRSIKEASETLKIPYYHINRCCRNIKKSINGFIWKYK
jgi:hypothetical protein